MSHGQRTFVRVLLPFTAVGFGIIGWYLAALLALGLWAWIEFVGLLPEYDGDDYEDGDEEAEV